MNESEQQSNKLPQDRKVEKVSEEGLVVHFTRHKYDAYVRASGGLFDGFDVLHKHNHETRWRPGNIHETGLKAELERLNHELVEQSETPFADRGDFDE